MMLLTGQVAGISGVLGRALQGIPEILAWRGSFVCGLFVAGFIFKSLAENGSYDVFGPPFELHWSAAMIGGNCTVSLFFSSCETPFFLLLFIYLFIF